VTSPFVPGVSLSIAGAASGPLAGLTFAAKDLFDVAGFPTGGGNPDWARQYPIPTRHAWAVQRLLDAGATLIGKTVTDEVSLGILGENPFDGTPLNPAAPDRVPGASMRLRFGGRSPEGASFVPAWRATVPRDDQPDVDRAARSMRSRTPSHAAPGGTRSTSTRSQPAASRSCSAA
jgi:hypothetical protein